MRNDPPSTPWEFRFRAFVIMMAYAAGFLLGDFIQGRVFHIVDPTFAQIGWWFGGLGSFYASWVCAALLFVAWWLRFWGSSYHAAGVVFSGDVVAHTFTTSGPYRYVRNPLYLGNVLLAIGIGSLGPPVATVLVIAFNVWFVYRLITIEERFLSAENGEAYERYTTTVPRLIPRFTPAPIADDGRKPDWAYGFFTELFSLGFAVAMLCIAFAEPSYPSPAEGAVFWWIAVSAVLLQVALTPLTRRRGTRP